MQEAIKTNETEEMMDEASEVMDENIEEEEMTPELKVVDEAEEITTTPESEEKTQPQDVYNVGELRMKVRAMIKKMVEEEFERVIEKLGLEK